MSLYNCKQVAGTESYVITKFTDDLDVESSYVTSRDACECPAGVRFNCRHREMLPRFIAKQAVAGEWFYDYLTGQWVRASADEPFESDIPDLEGGDESASVEITTMVMLPEDATSDQVAAAFAEQLAAASIPGVTVVTLDGDPAKLYNAIADAVGEPRIESDIPAPATAPAKASSPMAKPGFLRRI